MPDLHSMHTFNHLVYTITDYKGKENLNICRNKTGGLFNSYTVIAEGTEEVKYQPQKRHHEGKSVIYTVIISGNRIGHRKCNCINLNGSCLLKLE